MKNGTSEYIPTSKPNCYTLKEGTSIIPKIPIEIKDKVEEIILPSSAKRIVDEAFSSCPNLKKITIFLITKFIIDCYFFYLLNLS